jgi:hypothetical protein
MRGLEGEAVLQVLRTLRNKADAAGSARPEGKNALFFKQLIGIFMNRSGYQKPRDKVKKRSVLSSSQSRLPENSSSKSVIF